MMNRPFRTPQPLVWLVALLLSACGDDRIVRPLPDTPQEWVAEVRARYGLPGLSAAIIHSGGTPEIFEDGVRRAGYPAELQPGDHFHLGGNVKAMTATVIARLVEQKTLSWNTTVLDAFPDLSGRILSIYGGVTVEQFLTHRGGVAEFSNLNDFLSLPVVNGTPPEKRAQFVEWLLSRPAVVQPGNYAHSNAGFTVAAAIAERMAGEPWETLIESRLFGPLSITAATGWPAAPDSTQPWGHIELQGQLVPHIPTGGYQVPFLLAPALDINMSTADWAKFVQLHLKGLRDEPGLLLEPATFRKLHEPVEGVAAGWTIFSAGGVVTSVHNGTAGTFDSYAVVQPSRDVAVIVVTNAVTLHSADALAEAASGLLILSQNEPVSAAAAPGRFGFR